MKVLENRVLTSSVGVARVSKVDIELTKLLAIPVGGRDISKALGVDDGDDGHLHAGIGKINTADAAFVFGGNAQVVLVRELLGVASWLQRGHLEGILLGDFLGLALLLLFGGNLVLDLGEIETHLLFPVAFVGRWALNLLLDDGSSLFVGVVADFLLEDLLDGELDFCDLDLAVAIVNYQVTLCSFRRRVDVLGELSRKTGCALCAASPRFDLRGLLDHVGSLKIDGLLTNDEHGLVLHVLALAVKHSLGEILDLGLGVLPVALACLEYERGGEFVWKLEAERDSVVTWSDLGRRLPNVVLVVQKLFGMLHLLLVMHNFMVLAVSFNRRPEAHEAILAATFDFQADASGSHDGLGDAHVDSSCYSVTWFVERLVQGDLHVALITAGFAVLE